MNFARQPWIVPIILFVMIAVIAVVVILGIIALGRTALKKRSSEQVVCANCQQPTGREPAHQHTVPDPH